MRKLYPLFALFFAFARAVRADSRVVALVAPDPQLERAVSLALSPWNVSAQVTQEASPGTDLPGAARRAAALARKLRVSVVVWVSPSDQGSLLWIYDADRDEVSTREIGELTPFSSPGAASVALSLKTILRTTEVAPRAERFGALTGAQGAHIQRLTLKIFGDIRYFSRGASELRGSLGAVWWLQPEPRRWGFGLSFAAGPGVDVREANFSGHYRQPSVSAASVWQVIGTRWLASSLYGGASVHFAQLSGSSADEERKTIQRVLPSFDAGTELDLKLGGGFQVGLAVRALYLPRPQRYLVKGESVLELWPVAGELGVRLGLNLL